MIGILALAAACIAVIYGTGFLMGIWWERAVRPKRLTKTEQELQSVLGRIYVGSKW